MRKAELRESSKMPGYLMKLPLLTYKNSSFIWFNLTCHKFSHITILKVIVMFSLPPGEVTAVREGEGFLNIGV